jgi:hypothetical protein
LEVIDEYLLIDGTFGVNDVINPSSSEHDDGKSTQSKEKVKEIEKESESKEKYNHDDELPLSNNNPLGKKSVLRM